MCTIHLFDGVNPDVKQRHLEQIEKDWKSNPDGGSVLILDDHNEVTIRFQTIKLRYLMAMLKTSKGTTYVVHLRNSTTAQQGVPGCHMFDSPSGEWIYCHNGIIWGAGYKHRVDSLQLGNELDSLAYVDDKEITLPNWQDHDFANVIAYHTIERRLFVHRSYSGQLHHDGDNWSSLRIDHNYNSVSPGWYNPDGSPIEVYPERRVIYGRFNRAWEHDSHTLPSRLDVVHPMDIPFGDDDPDTLHDGLVSCDLCQQSFECRDIVESDNLTFLCHDCHKWVRAGGITP